MQEKDKHFITLAIEATHARDALKNDTNKEKHYWLVPERSQFYRTPDKSALPYNTAVITTEHVPKSRFTGFVFGADRASADIRMNPTRAGEAVCGQCFAIKFLPDTGAVELAKLSGCRMDAEFDLRPDVGAPYACDRGRDPLHDVFRGSRVLDRELVAVTVHGWQFRFVQPWPASFFIDERERPLLTGARKPGTNALQFDPHLKHWLEELREGPPPPPRAAPGRLLKQYGLIQPLGEGASGTVYRAIHMTTGNLVAVKKYNSMPTTAMSEGLNQGKLDHPHITKIYELIMRSEADLVLAMELLPLGSLVDARNVQPFTFQEGRLIVKQALEALSHLHANFIMHRDIKPSNILVAWRDSARIPIKIKMTDFGFSKESFNGKFRTHCGTRGYEAPELGGDTAEKPYTYSADVWSLGALVANLWLGPPDYGDTTDYTITSWAEKLRKHAERTAWEGLLRGFLLKATLRVEPTERQRAEQCLKHAFVTHEDPEERRLRIPITRKSVKRQADEELASEDGKRRSHSMSAGTRDQRDASAASGSTGLSVYVDAMDVCEPQPPSSAASSTEAEADSRVTSPAAPAANRSSSPVDGVTGLPAADDALPSFDLCGHSVYYCPSRREVNTRYFFRLMPRDQQAYHMKLAEPWLAGRRMVVEEPARGRYVPYASALQICDQMMERWPVPPEEEAHETARIEGVHKAIEFIRALEAA